MTAKKSNSPKQSANSVYADLVKALSRKPPEGAFTATKLVNDTGASFTSASTELKRQEAAGLLESGKFGVHRYYWPK